MLQTPLSVTVHNIFPPVNTNEENIFASWTDTVIFAFGKNDSHELIPEEV